MIHPRWNRHANALLAHLGGSSRTASSSQHRALLRLKSRENSQRRGDGPAAPGAAYGDGGPPNRREMAKARRELLKMDRPKSQSRLYSQPARPQWKRRTRQGKDHAGVGNRRRQDQAHNSGIRRGSTSGGAKTAAPQQVWPQLKRRSRQHDKKDRHVLPKDDSSTLEKNGLVESPEGKDLKNSRTTTESSHLMLIIEGLSPSLNASDFYRLAPHDLSKWNSVIKKVQQQRDPKTLEPLGRYLVSFGTVEAAASYRDKLLRLHQLNGLKLKSTTGLWESTVPSSLRAGIASPGASTTKSTTKSISAPSSTAPDAATPATTSTSTHDLADLVDTFTLAPGSQDAISIQRQRVTLKRPWAKKLSEAVEPLGYGAKPHLLLLDVYPPILTAEELFTFIRLDGHNRGMRWQVCMPLDLKTEAAKVAFGAAQQESQDKESDADVEEAEADQPSFRLKDHDTWEKLKSRFVLVCADESEARRFQRSWNHRALTTSRPRPGRFIVHASVIKW